MSEIVQIEIGQLRQLMIAANELGANRVLVELGMVKKEIKKAEAYRRYSRRTVDGWIRDGRLVPVKRGRSEYLPVAELDVLAKTNELYRNHLKRVG